MPEILRPMSTGELMDRTFGLYKRNFKLFVGIASLGPATHLVFQLLTVSSGSLQTGNPARVNPFSAAGVGFGVAAGFVIMMAGIAIAHAATVRAVAAEFVLEGLHAHRRISRNEERGFGAEEKRREPRERDEKESKGERPNFRRQYN